MIDVSIIIPFYNSGSFIMDALNSVINYNGKYTYEIIIVDDGSVDIESLKLLEVLSRNYIVLKQKNHGPASARNYGVKSAKGRFLLFLDSDNKIKPDYIDLAVDILNSDASIGIVFSNPIFFGELSNKNRLFVPHEFDISGMLIKNYIDMCSVIRKEVWITVGGFDENRELLGYEDWDFWLLSYEAGWRFYFINKELFYYRVRKDSVVGDQLDSNRHFKKSRYIFNKHILLYKQFYGDLINNSEYRFKQNSNIYRFGLFLLKPLRVIKHFSNHKFFKDVD